MAPIPWNKKKDNLVKMRDFIIQRDFQKFDNTEMDKIGNHLGLNMTKCVKGVFVHRRTLRSLYLVARNYIFSIKAELSATNIGNYIVYKKVSYETDHTEAAKISFTLISENKYLTRKPTPKDIADVCTCSQDERCGPGSACENRYKL